MKEKSPFSFGSRIFQEANYSSLRLRNLLITLENSVVPYKFLASITSHVLTLFHPCSYIAQQTYQMIMISPTETKRNNRELKRSFWPVKRPSANYVPRTLCKFSPQHLISFSKQANKILWQYSCTALFFNIDIHPIPLKAS